jgi:hypothetical protein
LLASVCKKRLKKEDLNVYCNIHCGKLKKYEYNSKTKAEDRV